MDKKNVVSNYEAPQMEVLEIEIEKGFAASDNTEGFGPWQ